MHNSLKSYNPRPAFIYTEYIELDKLLKKENCAASGGEARYLIGQGLAWVNDVVETRKRRKLYPGDRIRFNGIEMQVTGKAPCSVVDEETEQGHQEGSSGG
jgi:ribosome-associated protein